jgi:hypothetical protein
VTERTEYKKEEMTRESKGTGLSYRVSCPEQGTQGAGSNRNATACLGIMFLRADQECKLIAEFCKHPSQQNDGTGTGKRPPPAAQELDPWVQELDPGSAKVLRRYGPSRKESDSRLQTDWLSLTSSVRGIATNMDLLGLQIALFCC